jgi:hypothetical protein
MVQSSAELLRIFIDFESSTAAGLDTTKAMESFKLYKSERTGDEDALDQLFGMIEAYLVAHSPSSSGPKSKRQVDLEKKALELTETVRNFRLAAEYIEPDKSFRFADIFNVIMGMLDGSMGAVESNIYSFQCSKNSTAARADIVLMR